MSSLSDVAGRRLKIGDKVVTTFEGYADLEFAKVVGFTPKKIGLTRIKTGDYAHKFPNQVCKVES